MQQYHDLLEKVLTQGVKKEDRTGTGTRSLFGEQIRFDLSEGFPLLTTKNVHFKSVVHELLWFLRGDTNVRNLQTHGVKIWDQWAKPDGNLGPIYGKQWRHWKAPDGSIIDQLANAQETIRTNPDCRRIIVNAWNVGEIPEMQLPPCHLMYQFYVVNGKLSLMWTQRSVDIFIGLSFNIASYALLCQMMARVTGLQVGELIGSFGDVHLYSNHVEQAQMQLSREARKLPTVILRRKPENVWEYEYDDIMLAGYDPHPAIKAPVAV